MCLQRLAQELNQTLSILLTHKIFGLPLYSSTYLRWNSTASITSAPAYMQNERKFGFVNNGKSGNCEEGRVCLVLVEAFQVRAG
jgi:hypothetical protein